MTAASSDDAKEGAVAFQPIGRYRAEAGRKYDVPRQGYLNAGRPGVVELEAGGQLVQLPGKRDVDLPEHVVAKQSREPCVCPGQRHHERRKRGAEQAQAQRAGPSSHGTARR